MPTLTGTEVLKVRGVLSTGVPSGEEFQCTTQNIADLGGGGGSSTTTPVSTLIASGASNTVSVTTNVLIGWNSATTSAKAQTIPAPTTKDQIIVIKDIIGTAATYNITITPVSGTIDTTASLIMSSNKSSITLQADGISNWMVI